MFDMLQIGILQLLARFRRDESGAALVEYGLLVGLIAAVCAVAVGLVGTQINALFNAIAAYLPTVVAGVP